MERETLAAYAYQYQGAWDMIARAVVSKQAPVSAVIRERYITILDAQYPSCLRQLASPPWVLFYQGNIGLLEEPMITIVGSRDLSPYGEHLTALAADELKKRFVLVSGLAKGADAIVHRQALEGGRTIGIIGSGLGTRYPKENRDLYEAMASEGLILSEYPYHCGVKKENFPWRNRIIAALGQACIVTAAKQRSGTMITVNEALAVNRDIYTFPYPFNDEAGRGCDILISEGANILYTLSQLKEIRPKLIMS
jgi:DNA processing protein